MVMRTPSNLTQPWGAMQFRLRPDPKSCSSYCERTMESMRQMMDDMLDEAEGLRVVHVVLSLDLGGLERIVIDLVREARTFGQLTSVVCLERPGMLAAELEALRVPVFCVEK